MIKKNNPPSPKHSSGKKNTCAKIALWAAALALTTAAFGGCGQGSSQSSEPLSSLAQTTPSPSPTAAPTPSPTPAPTPAPTPSPTPEPPAATNRVYLDTLQRIQTVQSGLESYRRYARGLFTDIDGDGADELVILHENSTLQRMAFVYTQKDGKAIPVLEEPLFDEVSAPRGSISIVERDGTVYLSLWEQNGGMSSIFGSYRLYTFADRSLTLVQTVKYHAFFEPGNFSTPLSESYMTLDGAEQPYSELQAWLDSLTVRAVVNSETEEGSLSVEDLIKEAAAAPAPTASAGEPGVPSDLGVLFSQALDAAEQGEYSFDNADSLAESIPEYITGKFKYFLWDLDGDGVSELAIGKEFLNSGVIPTLDLRFFRCEASGGGYTLQPLTGCIPAQTVYTSPDGSELYLTEFQRMSGIASAYSIVLENGQVQVSATPKAEVQMGTPEYEAFFAGLTQVEPSDSTDRTLLADVK